jgi:uncharacterized small protein (DUF1192 family)
MIDDETTPISVRKPVSIEAQLENASIDELEQRIAALRAEIALCEKSIASKRAQRAAADSVFGARSS